MTLDEHEIHAIVQELVAAWNAGDGNRFAASFAEDADFINVAGIHASGRATIGTEHQRIFDTIYKGSRNRYDIESIRWLGTDAAAVLIQASLQFSIGGAWREIHARPTVMLACEAGHWQIVAFQNTMILDPQRLMAAALQA